MKTKCFPFFPLLLLAVSGLSAQTNSAPDPSSEIRNERSMYSSVYLKENGDRVAVISPAPVHYRTNGGWENINTNITASNGGFQNETNVIRSFFPGSIDSSSSIKLIVNDADEIYIHSEKEWVASNELGELTPLRRDPLNAVVNVAANNITYPGIYPGMEDSYTILNGEIKNDVLLNTAPSFLNNLSSEYFGFRETVELPAGWKITTKDGAVNAFAFTSLIIIDAEGRQVLTIPEPVFYDNYGIESDGLNPVEGKYLLKQENNEWNITTLVPVSWLKDANTRYPVSIDPTVTIAGTTGGWQSPNNFVDNPGFVFIGVCCSNLTHRAWIKFNTTTIPAGSCITDVEVQPNVTSVANATAELVWIDDVTGAFGPYGAIVPAAYTDFGTGPYTSFTITSAGVYGYYVLGASANTLLQTQLPLGWFQVAFMMNNEPTTNYKIMSGTTSNLMVTYTNCALPVELLSFTAECNNGNAELNWTTASQTNNDHFTISRTTDGTHYEAVATIPGAGTSSEQLSYSFEDPQPLNGTVYYALSQTDINGHTEELRVVPMNCLDVPQMIISPNPGNGMFSIEGTEPNSDLVVKDVLGRVIFKTRITGDKTEIDLGNEPDGIYFVQVIAKNSDRCITKTLSISRQN